MDLDKLEFKTFSYFSYNKLWNYELLTLFKKNYVSFLKFESTET